MEEYIVEIESNDYFLKCFSGVLVNAADGYCAEIAVRKQFPTVKIGQVKRLSNFINEKRSIKK